MMGLLIRLSNWVQFNGLNWCSDSGHANLTSRILFQSHQCLSQCSALGACPGAHTLTCKDDKPLFLLSPHFLLQPLNSHQQSPVNAPLKVTGWLTHVTSSLPFSHSLQGTLLPSTSHHSQFSIFHLKTSHEYIFMHLLSYKSFCSPFNYLSKISEYSSVSLVRNNVPVLSRSMSKNNRCPSLRKRKAENFKVKSNIKKHWHLSLKSFRLLILFRISAILWFFKNVNPYSSIMDSSQNIHRLSQDLIFLFLVTNMAKILCAIHVTG